MPPLLKGIGQLSKFFTQQQGNLLNLGNSGRDLTIFDTAIGRLVKAQLRGHVVLRVTLFFSGTAYFFTDHFVRER